MDSVFKALSHPVRRQILEELKDGPLSAGEIAEKFGLANSTLSAHFAKLQNAGLIDAERQGTTIRYHLNLSVLQEAMLTFVNRFTQGGDT